MYIDINFNYYDPSKKLLIQDQEVLNQSIRNLFNTFKGSRFFNRSYGSNLYTLVFEEMSPGLLDVITITLYNEIEEFEPRIIIPDISYIKVSFDYNKSMIVISVTYNIVGLQGVSGNFFATITNTK